MKKEDFDLIEKYKADHLNVAEQEAFKLRISQDEEFADFVRMEEDLHSAFHFNEAQKLKQLFTVEKQQVVIPFYKNTLFKVAVVITLIIASTILFLNRKPDFEDLYAQYYEPYPNVSAPVLRSGNDINKAFYLYEKAKYEQALTLFLKQDREEGSTFYVGQCYLAIGSYLEARESFKKVIEVNNEFAVASQWYLALVYIQLEEEEKAKGILYSLNENGKQYAQKAQELLEALD